MLEVPARTMGLNAAWTTARWSLTGSVSRAADWVKGVAQMARGGRGV